MTGAAMKNPAVEAKLLSFLNEYTSGNDLYWFPLTRLKKDIPVAAYDIDAIYKNGDIALLEHVFKTCRIDRVSTFQTDSMEYFDNDSIFDLLYEKDRDVFVFPWTFETFYFDSTEKWLVYVSHEGTISFTGGGIVQAAEKTIPHQYVSLIVKEKQRRDDDV